MPGVSAAGESVEFFHKRGLVFSVSRINRDAVDRANLLTLWLAIVTDAFGAFTRVYDIDVIAGRNGLVGAFRLADIAVDAVICDY